MSDPSPPAALALWDIVLPGTGPPVHMPSGVRARHRLAGELRAKPAGLRLVVLDQGPLAGRRLGRLARQAGLDLELEYLAVPSLGSPLFFVERCRVTQTYFARRLLMVPPRLHRGRAAAGLLLRLLRLPRVWDLVGGALCGRVTIWRRG